MIIGIDASRAFQSERTGIEEYSYQVIKHLMDKLDGHQVILYVRDNFKFKILNFKFPDNWKVKIIKFPYLWTQVGLSLELLFHPVDVLFIPAHIVPLWHPKNTIVTIHGLEYEFCSGAYSFWERLYMRWAIRRSCRVSRKIIAVSENTKKDLIELYQVPEDKVKVIYEGVNNNLPLWKRPASMSRRRGEGIEGDFYFTNPSPASRVLPFTKGEKYLLFIGRLEERKNIVGIVKAFETLKEQYKIPHKLVLAGKFGYGKEKIMEAIKNVNCVHDIILAGYVGDEEKWELLKNTDVFLFPTLYEGFGLPVLEAQAAGVPVVAGNNSSIPEITNLNCHSERNERAERENEVEESNSIRSLDRARDDTCSALLVNPHNAEEIADTVFKLISDETLRNDIINRGYENVKRFSWEKCADSIAKLLNG